MFGIEWTEKELSKIAEIKSRPDRNKSGCCGGPKFKSRIPEVDDLCEEELEEFFKRIGLG